MDKVYWEMDGHVAVVTMNSGENRFSFPFFEAFLGVLDEVENNPEAKVMVVRSSHEKVWSNGIDLDWLGGAVEKEGAGLRNRFLAEMFGLMRRVLTFPMPTVAAINGHAFAGGAFLSFAHDFRFMRSDRGWICLPEVDLGMPLGPVFTVLCKRAIPMYKFEEMQYTGCRLTAAECQAHHIIMKACPLEDLLAEATAFARSLNKDRQLIRTMKLETHKDGLAVMDETIASLSG